MKSLLLIFFFAAGFVVTEASAQNCTPKQVAECKMAPCASACKGSAAAVNVQPVGVAALASFTPEAITTACAPGNVSDKDMKACQAKCAGASKSNAHGTSVAGTQQGCSPAPGGQVKGTSVASPSIAPASKPVKQ